MTTILMCLAVVALLPYVLAGTGSYFKLKQFGKVDNKEPRPQASLLKGAGGRAWAAQANAWEALAFFATACVIVILGEGDLEKAACAALVFVGARVLHPILYIANIDILRSLVFGVGFAAGIYMMYLGICSA